MKKLLSKSISVLLALLMMMSSTITAFALAPSCTVLVDDAIFFGGKTRTASAEFLNIPAAEADGITAITWTLVSQTTNTDYSDRITIYNFNKSEVSEDSTVEIKGMIGISIPQVYDEQLVLKAECNSTYYAEKTLTVLKPIDSISVSEADSSAFTFFDEKSSTFYLDQAVTGTLKLTTSPEVNDDGYNAPSISPSSDDSDKQLSCVYNAETDAYDYFISKNAPSNSIVTYSTKSGNSKSVNVVKCIKLASFKLQCYENGTSTGIYASTATPDNFGNSYTAVQNKGINIVEYDAKSINGGKDFNDDIEYKLYNSSGISATNYSIEPTDSGCTLTIFDPGNYVLEAKAISFLNGKLQRTLYCKMNISVTAPRYISDVQFNSDTYKLYYAANKTTTLEVKDLVTFSPSTDIDDNLVYESLDTSVATIDSTSGLLTVVPGNTGESVKIVAKSKNNPSACDEITIIIIPKVQTITLDAPEAYLPVGHGEQIAMTVSPSTSPEVIYWTSNNTDVASVDQSGYVTALAVGSAEISATSESGVISKITINVVESKKAVNVTLTPEKVNNAALQCVDAASNTYSIYQGDTITVTCDMLDANSEKSNDKVEWRATIDNGDTYSLSPLDELYNYFRYTVNSNDTLTITTEKTSISTVRLYAFAVVGGKSISIDGVPFATLTLINNVKSNSITFNPSATSKTLPVGEKYEFSISKGPNGPNCSDKIALVSTNTDVADVNYNELTGVATVRTKQVGTAQIICYTCYDVNNPAETATYSKTLKLTVANNIDAAEVYGIYDVFYNGKDFKITDFPSFSVYFADYLLTKDIDYTVSYSNNKNSGVASVIITGKGAYNGTKTVNFNIVPKIMNESEITVTVGDVTYNGTEQTPKVTVKDTTLGKTLTLNTDYVLSYSNNIASGTAYVTVTGIGNYQGSIAKAFAVNPLAITAKGISISAIPNQIANGSAFTPEVIIKHNDTVLTNGVDYVVSFDNNVNPGKAAVTI
ncbi:MAG: Ig domain-containing protein, partial [Eubacterium sp.]